MSTFTYAVYFQYATAQHKAGDVLSRHHSYDAAEKAAKRSGYSTFLAIRDLTD